MATLNQQSIWFVVSQIPKGRVASYLQVAKQAGIPNAARVVGNTLRQLPIGSTLPWHRVVNSQGKISPPSNTPRYLEQKQRLECEGIIFNRNTIPANYFAWDN